MKAQITVEYLGIHGTGPTVREAKAHAARVAQQIIRDADECPTLLRAGKQSALVFSAGRGGWSYAFLELTDGTLKRGAINATVFANWSKREAELACAEHLLDCAWSSEVEDDRAFCSDAQTACGLRLTLAESVKIRDNLLWRWNWQRAYKAARAAGHDDQEARDIACRTPLRDAA